VIKHFYHVFQCVTWYPQQEPDDILAIGQSNGKVIITRLLLDIEHYLFGFPVCPGEA